MSSRQAWDTREKPVFKIPKPAKEPNKNKWKKARAGEMAVLAVRFQHPH